ncbi:MAG: effector binding domain-containing protein [Clostridia bacterium]|nr:effector binding domain-containing protein [Clostridia bacterium]
MNQLMTVTQVSRACGVSARMLRYYEKMGLIASSRVEDYAYRMYDPRAVARLVQILVLRRLRIPLRDIALILQDEDPARRQAILRGHIALLDQEAGALETIRGILSRLADHAGDPAYLTSPEMLSLTEALAPAKTTLKEEGTVSEQNNAVPVQDEKLNVRILHLPPMTVASYHYIGKDPEEVVGDRVCRFIQESGLYEVKPDARMFGFNHPNPGILEDGLHGYEDWVTIPEDFPLPEDFTRRQFSGGLYAALTIRFPEFQYWWELNKWVEASSEFDIDWRGDERTMGGCLEEHLNWVRSAHLNWPKDGSDGQLDLLFPVKRREKS